MKILCAEYNPEGQVTVIPVGDNALLRNNDDFYIPEFATEISCVSQFVVRLCKLGKSVGMRFAGRYYEEIGVGIRFYADDLERTLQSLHLPVGVASSFDGSAAISNLIGCDERGTAMYSFLVNGKVICEEKMSDLPVCVDQLIAYASDFHTLKIGDFLFCGNRFRYRGLQLGDRLQVYFQGKELMDFKLK